MHHLALRQQIPLQAPHNLMHPHAHPPAIFLGNRHRLNLRVELRPLPRPIRANLVLAHNRPTLRSLRPSNVFCHQR